MNNIPFTGVYLMIQHAVNVYKWLGNEF